MKYMCDICQAVYDTEEAAKECEQSHISVRKLGLVYINKPSGCSTWVWHKHLEMFAIDDPVELGSIHLYTGDKHIEFWKYCNMANASQMHADKLQILGYAKTWLLTQGTDLMKIAVDDRVDALDDWNNYFK